MTATMHDDLVVCGNVTIPFRYCWSRHRKTMGITVRSDRSVTVRVPLGTSRDAIRNFVNKRAKWIAKAWRKLENFTPESVQRYDDGARFKFMGREYILMIKAGQMGSVALLGDSMVVTTHSLSSPDHLRLVINAWYLKQAAEIFRERAIACHHLMEAETLPLPAIVIRPMKSRWGSYSYRTGRITLNLFLVKTSQACLDYVIIHELCHIKIRHHGPGFWKLVGRYMPDYVQRRKQLGM